MGRRAIHHVKQHAPDWLPRLRVQEGHVIRHRFGQPGGGYDRNVIQTATRRAMIESMHANPVRRGLVARAEDWEWSSARWFAGLRPVPMDMDRMILDELASDEHAHLRQRDKKPACVCAVAGQRTMLQGWQESSAVFDGFVRL